MVSQDSQIKEPLEKISDSLNQLKENLLSVGIVINEIIGSIPFDEGQIDKDKFTKKIKKHCLSTLRGGFWTLLGVGVLSEKVKRVGEAEESLRNNFTNLTAYLESGGPKKRRGDFLIPYNYWKENQKKIATYRATIIANFSWKEKLGKSEAILYGALTNDKFEELTLEKLQGVEQHVTGFLAIVKELTSKINKYQVDYKAGGYPAVEKASVKDLAAAK